MSQKDSDASSPIATKGQKRFSVSPNWPRQMRAATAAAYVDEPSVEAFRRAVGTLYPNPRKISGKGDRWLREDLDAALDRIHGKEVAFRDAADVLS